MTETINKEQLLQQAKRSLDEGRIDRAIQEYQRIVAADPRDYRVRLRIAELYVRLKQIPKAVHVYQDVAAAYADEGFYLKAVTVYKNILRLNPSLREVNAKLADLYEKMGLAQDAINQYQILVSVSEQKGDHKGVLDVRRRIVALDPANITNRIRLAESYQVEGQDHASLQEYEALAEQLKESGEATQLIDLYEKVLARRPDHHEFLQRVCRLYYRQGEYKKALRRIEASAAVAATDPELLTMQAEMYWRQNQLESAKGKWQEVAELYRRRGEPDQALAACENILIAAPEAAETIAEMVEAIRPGALEAITQRAAQRRAQQVKAEAEAEQVEYARKRAAAQIAKVPETPAKQPTLSQAPRATAGPLRQQSSEASTEALLRKGRASEELAKMYEQMGLADEAEAEWAKVLESYRRVLVAGAGGPELVERVHRLEMRVTIPTAMPTPEEPSAPRDSPASAPPSKPASTPTKPAGPGGKSPKKRISFV
ncbi:MAG: tetratricopeptide repeat protein [Deltaproteobacteria bacterium]|nr:tetratricopeptide repeat protein [Deltaproteobacteria bacterium]